MEKLVEVFFQEAGKSAAESLTRDVVSAFIQGGRFGPSSQLAGVNQTLRVLQRGKFFEGRTALLEASVLPKRSRARRESLQEAGNAFIDALAQLETPYGLDRYLQVQCELHLAFIAHIRGNTQIRNHRLAEAFRRVDALAWDRRVAWDEKPPGGILDALWTLFSTPEDQRLIAVRARLLGVVYLYEQIAEVRAAARMPTLREHRLLVVVGEGHGGMRVAVALLDENGHIGVNGALCTNEPVTAYCSCGSAHPAKKHSHSPFPAAPDHSHLAVTCMALSARCGREHTFGVAA